MRGDEGRGGDEQWARALHSEEQEKEDGGWWLFRNFLESLTY